MSPSRQRLGLNYLCFCVFCVSLTCRIVQDKDLVDIGAEHPKFGTFWDASHLAARAMSVLTLRHSTVWNPDGPLRCYYMPLYGTYLTSATCYLLVAGSLEVRTRRMCYV